MAWRRRAGCQKSAWALDRRRPAPCGEQSGGGAEIQIRHEQPLLSIRLIALQRTIRTGNRRCDAAPFGGAVYRREIARVLRRATQDGFLVEGVGGIGERDGTIAPGFGDMRVRVKDDLRASTHGPPHRLWIAPAFVANHYTEGQRPGGEDPTFGPERGICD